jgi:CTP synthase (UTP-ammonia lyase)
MLNNENINVHFHDVHYYFEVNSNLLFLSVLKEKHHTFNAKNEILRVLNDDEDVVLVINKQRSVYVLYQFIEINQYELSLSSIFSIKSKSVNMKVWHQRVDHVNEKDLFQLSLIVIDVKFSDESIKSSFC